MNDHIYVLIPVFNAPSYTALCLQSLLDIEHGAIIKPVIINNASRQKVCDNIYTWATAFELKTSTKPIIINSDKNVGFAGALNLGLESVSPNSYVCILHNDTIVYPNWIVEMVKIFESADEDVAVVCPRTNYANEVHPCFPQIRTKFETLKLGNKDRPSVEQLKELIAQTYPDETLKNALDSVKLPGEYSPDISSFCMLTKSDIFAKYGKFDEDFWPRGFEDKFWFMKMERDGYICMIANKAYVHHWGNISSDGPGFCFPDMMKQNEQKYKEKCAEIDRAGISVDN